MPDFVPTASDIAWTQGLVDILRDGGVWMWPGNTAMYRCEKATRQFVLIERGPLFREAIHQRLVTVAAQMSPAWTVVDAQEGDSHA